MSGFSEWWDYRGGAAFVLLWLCIGGALCFVVWSHREASAEQKYIYVRNLSPASIFCRQDFEPEVEVKSCFISDERAPCYQGSVWRFSPDAGLAQCRTWDGGQARVELWQPQ